MLLIVCIGAPVLEMYDQWDHTLQDGNDTESNVVVVVLCVGIGFVMAAAMTRLGRPSLSCAFLRTALDARVSPFLDISHIQPTPHASPPTTLRV
jgi:hypothetical protein